MMDLSEIYSIHKMNKIILAMKSRTVWTILAIIVINGVPAVTEMLPVDAVPFVNVLLGILATYFKVTPSQNYK